MTGEARVPAPTWLPPVVLCLVATLLHAPFLGRPFGVHEINAASYFGVFARNWEALGFWALRGAPLGPMPLPAPDSFAVVPYFSHPPGAFWLYALAGSSEGALRAVSALGHLAAAWLLSALLRPALGAWPALLAGILTLGFPVLAFYTQVSYEPLVLPAGLLLLLAWQRGWRRTLVLAALLGPWLDWQLGFFCAALAVLAWRRPLRRFSTDLAPPAAAAALSVAAILAWRAWAQQPWPQAASDGAGLRTLLERTVATRPALADFLPALWARLVESFTLPCLGLAALGLPLLAGRAPRLCLALVVAGLLNPLVFPAHSMSHTLYVAYLGPVLAAAIAALARGPRPVALVVALLACASASVATLELRGAASTPFFRDLGRLLTEAARGQHPVCFHLPYCYGYYLDTPWVWMTPIDDPALLEAWRTRPELPAPIRCLWTRLEDGAGKPSPWAAPKVLEQYLARFPRERVPELEQRIVIPPRGDIVQVAEAWLVTLAR